LLPRWRGAAPIQRAIEAGDAETGVGIMLMEAGLDTGPVILERRLAIAADETAASLHDRLATLGAAALTQALALEEWQPQPQADQGLTYAHKLDKAEARLDWHQPADVLERRIRAFNPVPGAFFELKGERIKVLAAELVQASGPAGQTLDDRLTVACGSQALRLTLLQPAGKAAMEAKAFLNGRAVPQGQSLLPDQAG
jgi:methionyl-tRNA formyltransferase